MPSPNVTYTLFLWPHGLFPRRIIYQLLASCIVPSTSALFSPKPCPSYPNFTIRMITLDPSTFAWQSSDPADPKPDGKSMPALRITDQTTKATRWIHESTSILLYLEAAFPPSSAGQAMLPADPIDLANAHDMLLLTNEVIFWSGGMIRHADPSSSSWSGMTSEQQSKGAAEDALRMCRLRLVQLQEWAAESLRASGWLTPGVGTGPGAVDVSLMAWLRYLEVTYEWDALGDARLESLVGWKRRMETVGWLREFEEDKSVEHPGFLRKGGMLSLDSP